MKTERVSGSKGASLFYFFRRFMLLSQKIIQKQYISTGGKTKHVTKKKKLFYTVLVFLCEFNKPSHCYRNNFYKKIKIVILTLMKIN